MNIIRFPTTVTALCVAIIAALGTPFASASPYPAIYAFGDSLSDAGNFSASTLGVVPAPPYSGGRFSNGPVWVQFLGALLGSGPVDPSLRGGTDFAWGLAETGSTPVHQLSPRDLPAQFSQFVSQVPVPQPGALYTVWAGANDLLNILSTPNLTPAAAATAVLYAVANVDAFVSNLAGRGAQNLLVLNVPNLGLTPSVLRDGPGPSQEATLLSQWFNGWLTSSLENLASTDALNLHMVDTYSLLDSAIGNPGAFGFANVTDPCWSGTYFGSGGSVCSPTEAGQDTYLFWDGLHPTERGHAYVALTAEAALSPPAVSAPNAALEASAPDPVPDPIPEPATLSLLGIGIVGMALLRRTAELVDSLPRKPAS